MARSFLNTVSLAFYSHLFVWHIIFVPYSLRCYHTGEWRWLRQHPSTNICPCFLPRMMRLPRLWQICAWLTWARIWSVSVRSAPMALCASERLFSSHRSWQTSCWPRWPLKVNLYLQIHSPAGKTCWLLRLQNHCCFFLFFLNIKSRPVYAFFICCCGSTLNFIVLSCTITIKTILFYTRTRFKKNGISATLICSAPFFSPVLPFFKTKITHFTWLSLSNHR